MSYNPKCYELAVSFLLDDRNISNLVKLAELTEELAQEIQDVIEMFLESEGLTTTQRRRG